MHDQHESTDEETRIQSVVVTGGGRGIGRAIAEEASRAGWAVVVVERDPAAVAWTESAGATVIGVAGDAGDAGTLDRALEAAEGMAPLGGWVNNAAVFDDPRPEDGPDRLVSAVTANLRPTLAGSQRAAEWMRERRTSGSIVNLSSHQAGRPVPGAIAYATGKAAIEGATRAFAVLYGPIGIRVNAVALGSIVTERHTAQLAAMTPEERDANDRQMAQIHPLGRMGAAMEVARTVLFLLSPAASYVTGAVLPVDGGRSVLGADPESRGLS